MSTLYDSLNENPAEQVVSQQCQHRSKAGNQCPRRATEGETLCVLHGASLERTKEQVQRRLIALQEKSVAVVEEILAGYDDKVRLAAATAVLDRTGLGPKSTIAFDDAPDLTKLNGPELTAQLKELVKQAEDYEKLQRMNDALMNSVALNEAPH